MLFLLQAAAQHLPAAVPPIHAVVDSVPVQPGMPEWQKTLLSASVGAVFAILASLAMEYIKPWLSDMRDKKQIGKHLADELLYNLAAVDSARRVLNGDEFKHIDRPARIDTAWRIASIIKTDRFDHFMATEKRIVYDIDSDSSLVGFYLPLKEIWPRIIERRSGHLGVFAGNLTMFLNATFHLGHKYVSTHKLLYQPKPNMLEQMWLYVPPEEPPNASSEPLRTDN
jgi:hypothetical protein